MGRLTELCRKTVELNNEIHKSRETLKELEKKNFEEIKRINRLISLEGRGVDSSMVEKCEAYIYIRNYKEHVSDLNYTDAVLRCIELAIKHISVYGYLQGRIYFYPKAEPLEPILGNSEDSSWFTIGVKYPKVSQSSPIPEEDRDACIYYLLNLKKILG